MYRKLVAAVAVLAVLLGAGLALRGSEVQAVDEARVDRLIQVNGTGEVQVKPDMASLQVAVETTGNTARAAQEQNARAMQEVISTLKTLGIAEKDIQTTQLSLYPIYESTKPERPQEEPQPPRVIGFRAENGVQVTVRKLDDLGKAVDAVVASGANRIQGISFGLSDPRPWQDRALEEAVADARRQAELAAKAAGVQIKGVRNISVHRGGIPIIRGPMLMKAEAGYGAAPPVMPGELTIQVSVSMTFEF
ncbi:MAG: SIMPL domain-containing protein [Bacillota bacterium]